MGAVLIGIGVAVAVLGLLIGASGFGSIETSSGAALVTAGCIAFVGGLLLFALGFIHRALIDLGHKLDGAIHFETEDEGVHGADRLGPLELESEPFAPALPLSDEEKPAAQRAPRPAPAPSAHSAAASAVAPSRTSRGAASRVSQNRGAPSVADAWSRPVAGPSTTTP